ncbi:MAG: glycoside hydrolase family 172 protein [Candidatus Glassbacteria bacterium]
METTGAGQFVGVNYFVTTPTPMWYGEGDDMFFIDGEKWPSSLHGTGTEDYFNMSWCPRTIFQHPYYGLVRLGGQTGWMGRTHLYRFHIQDPVRFSKSLRATIEHGHDNCLTLEMASVAYWYQAEPHKPFPRIEGRQARRPLPEIGAVDIHRWRDAWRRSRGNSPTLWGNEDEEKK